MKATLLLRKDHERVHELFEKFSKPSRFAQDNKRIVFGEIRHELSLHSSIESEVFYAELRDNSTSKSTTDLVESLTEDHLKIEKLLQEISTSNGDDKLLESKVLRLRELVQAHIEREEEELFPEARRVLSEQRLEELGLDMEYRRRVFTRAVA